MKIIKKSFTLIELLISVALTAIIMTFLYQNMHSVDKTNKFYKKKLDDYTEKNKLVYLLYNDILLSTRIASATSSKTIKSNNIKYFKIKSKHSIKGFYNPNISYILFKNQKVLFRIESVKQLELPISQEDILKTQFNRFENIEDFDIYQSKKDFLIYYSSKTNKEFFQISTL